MPTAIRQKLFRDLAQEGARTVLVVFAIGVGVAGFTAVLSSYAILTRELKHGYLDTHPASATLRLDAIDDGLLSAVSAQPGIAAADARRTLNAQIEVPRGGWANLRLFVVKDYARIRISKLWPQQGAWPPATGEILIERDAFQVAGLRMGDRVKVKTGAGKEQSLHISGSVHDVGQAQARMENLVYGYITLDTLARLGEVPFLDRLNILVAQDPTDETHIRRVAASIRSLAESKGHKVTRVDIPPPGEHPHAHIMGLLLLSMSSFGFCILALSGILVVNLFAALMAAQIRQIGVMKAIGASPRQVASVYFSQALIVGAAAVLIAVPPGIAGGWQLCQAMALFLNFDLASFATPLWVYFLAAFAGIIVPLLASAYPVWNVSRIPVRTALGDSGVSADGFGTSRFDRYLAAVSGSARPLVFALRNSFRRRARLALTLATLGAGGLFFLSALNIRASMVHTLDRYFASRKFDLTVTLGGSYPMASVQRAIQKTPGVTHAEGWMVNDALFFGTDRFPVVAVPPRSRSLQLDIAAGRDLLPGDRDAVVVNSALASVRHHLTVGQTIAVRLGQRDVVLRVVGISKEQFSPPVAYVAVPYVEELTNQAGMVNSLRVTLDRHDRASWNAAKESIQHHLDQEHIRTQASASTADSRFGFDQHMVMIYIFLVIVSAIIAAIGGLGLMTTMSLNVLERRREMGVLRAIGATPFAVGQMVVVEGVAVSVLSWAMATVAAWPLSSLLGNYLVKRVFTSGLDLQFEVQGVLVWLVVSLFLGITASLLPAWSASRTTIREALTHE